MPDLLTDPYREGPPHHDMTGIYVRAMGLGGTWGSFNIAELDGPSLLSWLRSRGGENEWAESVVLILLGHKPEDVFNQEAGRG